MADQMPPVTKPADEAGTQQKPVTNAANSNAAPQAGAEKNNDETATLKAEIEKLKAETEQWKQAGLAAKDKYKRLKEKIISGDNDLTGLDTEDRFEALEQQLKDISAKIMPSTEILRKENEELKAALLAKNTTSHAASGANQAKAEPQETIDLDPFAKSLLAIAAQKSGKTLEQYIQENMAKLKGRA